MLKCVVCHPSDDIVATGDNQGRVLVWSNIFDSKRPIRSIYHWHTLPVADLVFSTEGSYMYSGGGEAALVKWNLFSEQKSVLPRLGSPICHVNISTDNSYVVSAHEDNALQIINSQRIVVQLIQGLTQGHFQGTKSGNLLPTGMVYDPHTKAIVMNGRPGHLQFYDITKDKQLFNLDITGRNFISQERDSVVLNTDVHKTAIDDRGIWLATTEYWYDEETSPQLWLKFWEFDTTKQTFGLNTNVILPHNKEVNCILFRPVDDAVSALPLAVTTSNDCKFKIWSLQQDTNSDQKQTWSCTSMGCYRDLPAGDACFSEEGSLLAVAFGKAATLWTVDSTALKAVLCNDKSKRNIVQTHFGRKSYCHLLVCHDGTSITVWDVLSLSITWIVHTEVQIIVGDRASDVIAAFCQNQNLILFRPNDPFPVYSLSNASKTPVISAVFVSKNTSCASRGSASFYEKSQLYFFNQEQKLLTLTDEPDTELETLDSTKRLISQNIPKTPFGMLQAEHKISNVEIVNPQPLTIHTKGDIKMVTIPCPTLQDPILLCSSLLSSFLIPKQNLVQ
ncbi:WD repeat-containing protein 75-like [Stegodyphus dumicola]|uniref:WD repeat-containing protein 75-like n=1 Tax=Stegodyphus dumicola TaxID=202533 RepID=UPI0015AB1254|nr:WD repeat-containing protein 75-like [Stegodyphus dumicola]